MKKVLVTGATGFIGRQSLQPLLDRDFEVHAVFHFQPLLNTPSIIWHKVDLLDSSATLRLCENIHATHLLHFAWYVNPKDYKTSSENEQWVGATLSLLRSFKENGGMRAVLAGTCMEYDWTTPQEFLSESTSPINPSTSYGRSKNETRTAAEQFANQNALSLAWGRIFMLYGPHEAKERLISYVINSLLSGQPALCTSGEQFRDFMHASDVGDAFTALLDSDVSGVVNIASGISITLKDIVVAISEMLQRPDLIQLGARQAPANEPARLVGDVSRLTNEVHWQPHIDLKKGLQETISWWKENRE